MPNYIVKMFIGIYGDQHLEVSYIDLAPAYITSEISQGLGALAMIMQSSKLSILPGVEGCRISISPVYPKAKQDNTIWQFS